MKRMALTLALALAGCDTPTQTSRDSAEITETEGAVAGPAVPDAQVSEAGTAALAPAKSQEPPLPVQATASTVRSLPLKRGFYVAADTPCSQASNATLRLVTREGINWSREVCTFEKIERTGPTSYRITDSCSGEPADYEVPNETSFTVDYGGGSQSSARYCPQASLPDPWRTNDISDVTG